MTDRRRWTSAETSKVVDLIQENYSFLFETISNAKSKKDIDEKWDEITAQVNALGSGKVRLTTDQVQRKWSDLKSTTKILVMKYRKGQTRTGGGNNDAKEPTELQWKIHRIIGSAASSGIVGAESCDSSQRVARVTSTSQSHCNISITSPQPTTTTEQSRSSPYLIKRPKKTPKQQQLEQNRELLKTEGELMDAVVGIRDEIQQMNSTLTGILYEFKTLVQLIAQGQQQQQGQQQPAQLQPVRQLFYNN